MPYIGDMQRRRDLANCSYPKTPGELNYAISVLVRRYIPWKKLNYQIANDIIGALECQKLEVYRRLIAPYEDQKIKENGDVY